jgi:hypothetical protein
MDPNAEPTIALDDTATRGAGAAEPTAPIPPTGSYPPAQPAGAYWVPPIGSEPPPATAIAAAPPPPRRERSYLGVLTVSAMIAVIGVLGIVDASGVAVPLAGYVAAALGVVAGGLVLGAWMGRSRGLIALGVLLGLALGPAVLVDAVAGSEWHEWNNADNIRVAPRTADELAPVYDYGAGSIRLDLTGLDFTDEDLATMIDMGAGEVIVTVPPEVDVVVDANVVVGQLTLFERQTSGFDAGETNTDLGIDGPGGGRLDLSIDLGLGSVEVRRATS